MYTRQNILYIFSNSLLRIGKSVMYPPALLFLTSD